jgi:hypothetical protein
MKPILGKNLKSFFLILSLTIIGIEIARIILYDYSKIELTAAYFVICSAIASSLSLMVTLYKESKLK